jgi:CheY-like chemotaxis protein
MKPRNTRVFVVEDSPIIRNLLIELIEGSGGAHVVGTADTAKAAIANIAALHPDAVTIDVRLKAGTGFDVLEALAVNEGDPPLRIVLTNYVMDAYREAAQGLDADYFFDKATQIRDMLLVLASMNNSQSARAA